MAKATCTVEGCERPNLAKGLCKAHYERNRRNGTSGGDIAAPRWVKPPQVCSVEGCNRRLKTNGYCGMHYQRWRKWGDPSYVGEQYGPLHPHWRADDIGYLGAHKRVARARGRASAQDCDRCGSPAREWAYDHSDPNEAVGSLGDLSGLVYSTDPQHYLPLCSSCHRQFDIEHKRLQEDGRHG